jgi:hypothetical protein
VKAEAKRVRVNPSIRRRKAEANKAVSVTKPRNWTEVTNSRLAGKLPSLRARSRRRLVGFSDRCGSAID